MLLTIKSIKIIKLTSCSVPKCDLCKNPPTWAVELEFVGEIDGPVSIVCDGCLWSVVPDPRKDPALSPKSPLKLV